MDTNFKKQLTMKTINLKNEITLWILTALPLAYLTLIWNTLPDQVALHFNINGKPDRIGNKMELFVLIAALNLGLYLLFLFLPKIDPKKTLSKIGNKYNLIRFILAIFFSILSLLMITSAKDFSLSFHNSIFIIVGLFIAILGNYFQAIKPNYFIGIRTPWTLKNEVSWKKTHRMGGRLWLAGGILLIILSFLLDPAHLFLPFMSIIIVISLIPAVYSYWIYKKETEGNKI